MNANQSLQVGTTHFTTQVPTPPKQSIYLVTPLQLYREQRNASQTSTASTTLQDIRLHQNSKATTSYRKTKSYHRINSSVLKQKHHNDYQPGKQLIHQHAKQPTQSSHRSCASAVTSLNCKPCQRTLLTQHTSLMPEKSIDELPSMYNQIHVNLQP